MDDRELRRYCAEVVGRLDVPAPFNVNDLCDRLEEDRGRAISLVPMSLPVRQGTPCGLWVATAEVDYILFEKDTSRTHQEHIVSHEIGHLLLGHDSSPAHQDEVARLLMPTLDPALVRSVLGRTVYTSHEERAAELVASLLPLRASRGKGRGRRERTEVSPGMANLVDHLERSLERHARRI
ncbi:hypothetical protein [Streptacidiphilus sp. P02-A3a]|uniref:hypothetical protein n=1 Tax=Streptacidiphilus sp. P02-A3a TaxID=2704468 RepID=UPI0015FBC0FE|nr:hypothetical protein [Streptacidiphilus sp. P02-A3a]QMU70617.1 hypothetical protein GXP74_22850 [Streptacidiphilus sp. P02-A3a]